MKIKTFKIGGIHMADHKMAAGKAIEPAPLPQRAVFPLSQHIGAPAKPVVKKGDKVKVGTLLAEAGGFISAPVHSSVSGTVFKIDQAVEASGYQKPVIIVNVEGDDWEPSIDRSEKLETIGSHPELDAKEIVERVKTAGVTGMGGAGFPTYVKLMPPEGSVECVILNGVECEPYITSDHRLMLEHTAEIVEGLRIIMRAVGVKRGYIGIEVNKPDAIETMEKATADDETIEVVPLKQAYPQGGEKQLIDAVINRRVPMPPAIPGGRQRGDGFRHIPSRDEAQASLRARGDGVRTGHEAVGQLPREDGHKRGEPHRPVRRLAGRTRQGAQRRPHDGKGADKP